ncbi:UDP-3-O-(3-hydroxymyristoyl)glucosamine N-acyltransferase [Lignipirellula cremea]|uniref:UDP-3-O-acylglucosamine N-acyltransferase n=1 Tax=Lignipirellula cremea TaxID=2528010 RepID=A0A518DPL8_9BACT|nr:UDP-3-O-(3-hydroxymyristoyl)glucosamine N-acyltransferase [Lignipirellula cremea]QDU93790.1 UDP-3-O-acylglucosamine N-acyltransferase [Lignipirellula cremea]
MAILLRQLAELVGGRLHGDGDLPILGAATIRDAQPGDITLADHPRHLPAAGECAAVAVVVAAGPSPDKPHLVVDNVHRAFRLIVAEFRPPSRETASGVSPAAQISPTARIGQNVTIYPRAYIGDQVEIGDGCIVHSGVSIMAGCRLGSQVVVYPNAVLYEDIQVGDRSVIHASAVIGCWGFGYETVNGKHQLLAQLGGVQIGSDVEIGAGSTIDRGAYTPTTIGDGTKIDNQVMIGHNCRIGRGNFICAQVGIAGSSSTGDYVVMAGQVGVGDHVDIGDQVRLAAKGGVMQDITESGDYCGAPAIPLREFFLMQAALHRLPEMRKQLRRLQDKVDSLSKGASTPVTKEAA